MCYIRIMQNKEVHRVFISTQYFLIRGAMWLMGSICQPKGESCGLFRTHGQCRTREHGAPPLLHHEIPQSRKGRWHNFTGFATDH